MRKILFASLLLLCSSFVIAAEKPTLVLYNWSEYLPKQVLRQFTKETGIPVRYSTYDSNEAMYAKVKTVKGVGYDLLVPSTYYLDRMRREGLLQKIDKAKLSNFGHLNPRLLNQSYDPNNDYSIPYLWGTTGIGYNTDKIPAGRLTSWVNLWEPAYKNKLLLLNDMREVFSMGLRTLGYSINTTDENQIRAAYEKLTELMPNVRVFDSESPKTKFLAGEVVAGMLWNGEVFQASQENPNIRYVYPKEGATLWVDSLVISAGAQNVDAAHQFIDFVLRPEIARQINEEVGYSSPNLAAIQLLPEKMRNNRAIYPTDEDLQNAEFQTDVGEALSIYDRYWQRLKAGR
ncbi:MAG TPA: extracellular solute-binding protein [Candidatus Competibacteraceae bacterium]|nr:extracellular solute-binding protein [Candidatus Competibacteraceae bacterium]HRZ06926.1 extracellular solute-binding protein [Candidatus Competibacteraceae bacterium]HSA46556.1 extracellular solute-binding protein [Candidatus Competibacteraceae bacterium]